jgi:hypothetical protein
MIKGLGQDFLEWDINDKGEVVGCRPFQAWLWVGVKVQNKDIWPGERLEYISRGGTRHQLIHPVREVKECHVPTK